MIIAAYIKHINGFSSVPSLTWSAFKAGSPKDATDIYTEAGMALSKDILTLVVLLGLVGFPGTSAQAALVFKSLGKDPDIEYAQKTEIDKDKRLLTTITVRNTSAAKDKKFIICVMGNTKLVCNCSTTTATMCSDSSDCPPTETCVGQRNAKKIQLIPPKKCFDGDDMGTKTCASDADCANGTCNTTNDFKCNATAANLPLCRRSGHMGCQIVTLEKKGTSGDQKAVPFYTGAISNSVQDGTKKTGRCSATATTECEKTGDCPSGETCVGVAHVGVGTAAKPLDKLEKVYVDFFLLGEKTSPLGLDATCEKCFGMDQFLIPNSPATAGPVFNFEWTGYTQMLFVSAGSAIRPVYLFNGATMGGVITSPGNPLDAHLTVTTINVPNDWSVSTDPPENQTFQLHEGGEEVGSLFVGFGSEPNSGAVPEIIVSIKRADNDETLVEDWFIVDGTSVPTLSRAGLYLFLLLATAGLFVVYRRRRSKTTSS